jgi:ribonuclease HI
LDFVAGKASSTAAGQPQKFYGVAVGHRPGVYTDWADAQVQVKDVKGPKYKKFETRAEAEEFVRSGGKAPAKVEVSKSTKHAHASSSMVQNEPPAAKRHKTSLPTSNVVRVYTDGSSRGNGRVGARAGVGVFFGPNDER